VADQVRPWDLFKKSQPKTIEGVREKRLEICKSCEHFIKLSHQCKKCGCFMDAKTRIRAATCPVGKW
jgi:hypothetical protein